MTASQHTMAGERTVGWYRDRYRSGGSVREEITRVLAELAACDDPAVVIGEPLHDAALACAEALDAMERDAAGALPLFGVPFVVKDNIDVAGAATSAGCPSFARIAVQDAVVVARLRAAGAVPVAKVNLDQFATGLVGTRSPYGTPRNPVHPTLVPGGSSSGSAVAVARGLVPFALGTDTAGSGRVPAALCELVGLKPTVGRVPNTGSVPAVRRIDCITVFATNVADAATAADVMAGPDHGDPWSRAAGVAPGPARRLGIPKGLETMEAMEAPALAAFEAAVALAGKRCGALQLVEVDVAPLLAVGSWLYGGPFAAERAVEVGAFLAAAPADADPVVSSIITKAMSATAVEAYRSEYALAAARRELAAFWDDVDVVLLPTTPGVATPEQVAADPLGVNSWLGTFTTFVNLLDLAAVALPAARRSDGLPCGVQLIGPAWSDGQLVDLAAALLGEPVPAARPAGRGEQHLVVVGAHLSGMALNHQLTSRGARLVAATRTAPVYRLHALAGTTPPKPGLRRVDHDGASIAVEVWALSDAAFGSFVAEVPAPLAIGTVELHDGSAHNGFVCEPYALHDAPDVTRFGGWRAYLEQR